jgi:hypothetical protein
MRPRRCKAGDYANLSIVMAGLVPAISLGRAQCIAKREPGTRPGMTK